MHTHLLCCLRNTFFHVFMNFYLAFYLKILKEENNNIMKVFSNSLPLQVLAFSKKLLQKLHPAEEWWLCNNPMMTCIKEQLFFGWGVVGRGVGGVRPLHLYWNYFTYTELIVRRWVKTGVPVEITNRPSVSRTCFSHLWPARGLNSQQWDLMIRS